MIYQAYTFVQIVFIILFQKIGFFSTHTFYGIDVSAYFMQLLTAATIISIGNYISKRRKGFDFVPDKPNGLIKVSKREKLLFILNLPTAAILISIMYLFNSRYFLAVPLIYAFLLSCYIYLSYAKDRSEDEYTKS
ncbi:hypothetical protein D3C76_1420900 [compost metagenome]